MLSASVTISVIDFSEKERLRVGSSEVIRISDPKITQITVHQRNPFDESILVMVSSVPVMHHYPTDLDPHHPKGTHPKWNFSVVSYFLLNLGYIPLG